METREDGVSRGGEARGRSVGDPTRRRTPGFRYGWSRFLFFSSEVSFLSCSSHLGASPNSGRSTTKRPRNRKHIPGELLLLLCYSAHSAVLHIS